MWKSKMMVMAGAVIAAVLLPALSSANIGFYLGTGIGYAFPDQRGDWIDELEPRTGYDLEFIHLGYNFTDNWGVSMHYGVGAGVAEDILGEDTVWGQEYLTFSGRYTFAGIAPFTPYLEAGLGNYVYVVRAEEGGITSDPAIGVRLALGANYYIGNFYLAPELSWHMAEYEQAELDHEYFGKGDFEFEEAGDMLVLLFKVGYHFRQ
ncbi:MAG: outer membrane beta-barrel protein [bacterium]